LRQADAISQWENQIALPLYFDDRGALTPSGLLWPSAAGLKFLRRQGKTSFGTSSQKSPRKHKFAGADGFPDFAMDADKHRGVRKLGVSPAA
jgi:hypothetical protein